MDKIIKELRDAAEDMLCFGDHEGPCDNMDEDGFRFPGEACETHIFTHETRKTRLLLAIAAFDKASRSKD